jgi:hypothetical protein
VADGAFSTLWRGIMCRAKRSTRPLDQVAQQLEALIVGTLDGSV